MLSVRVLHSPRPRHAMSQFATPRRILRFGSFEVDLASGELRRQGLKISLQDQPFRLLALLLERAGEVVTREELRDKLWPADTFVDFDHSLNTAVRKLREALGDSAETPRYVETLARRPDGGDEHAPLPTGTRSADGHRAQLHLEIQARRPGHRPAPPGAGRGLRPGGQPPPRR